MLVRRPQPVDTSNRQGTYSFRRETVKRNVYDTPKKHPVNDFGIAVFKTAPNNLIV